jgi:ATP-dependent helicase/nuclease subunit A
LEEHNRLLYVAMTRAKDRLIVAPFIGSRKNSPEAAWCEMVRRGFAAKAHALVRRTAPYGEVEIWPDGVHAAAPPLASPVPASPAERPRWLDEAVAAEPEADVPIRPSHVLAGRSSMRIGAAAEARLRGTLIHTLLERLPALAVERRRAAARAFVAVRARRLAPEAQERLIDDALAVIAHPAFAPLFGPGSRAEAPVIGRVRRDAVEVPVVGQIDRLAVLDGEVLIADFKTGRLPLPDEPAPVGYVAQLALYRLLLAEIYPGRRIRAFLVWTAGPSVQELSPEELEAALRPIKAA